MAWYLSRRVSAAPSPAGGLGLEVQAVGTTVTISVTARATAGTPPIYVDLDISAIDSETNEEVYSKTTTGEITDLSIPFTYMCQFTGEPGKTYAIQVLATFRNRFGEYKTAATKQVSIPGEAPKGEISVEVTVT